jgi:SAM-dependent methyltransferase
MAQVRISRRKSSDYLQSMRLWSNFFAVSGAEIAAMEKFVPLSSKNVLELGCGNGRLCYQLAQVAGRVTGVDLDGRLVQFASEYATRNTINNLSFMEMGAEVLDFDDNCFDVVIMPWMLHLVKEREAALAEARRVLKDGGHLFVFGLFGDCDYDRIARRFVPSRERELDPDSIYKEPLEKVFGAYEEITVPYEESDFSFVFPDCGVTAEAFTFAFSNWYETELSEKDSARLRHVIQHYRKGNHIQLRTRGALYVARKQK